MPRKLSWLPGPGRCTLSPAPVSPPRRASGAKAWSRSGPRWPQRVTDGDRAAAEIHFFLAQAQQLEHGKDLNGEGLVELEAINLIERKPGALECFLRRWHRPDSHFLGIYSGDGHGTDAGHRFQPSSRAFSSDMIRRAAAPTLIGEAVARRHRSAVGIERRRKRRQRLESRSRGGCTGPMSGEPSARCRRVPRSE